MGPLNRSVSKKTDIHDSCHKNLKMYALNVVILGLIAIDDRSG